MNMIKDLEGFPDYKISDDGSIYGPSGKRLKAANNRGYLQLSLKGVDGKYHTHFVHRLVAKTFIPNPESLETVDHRDCNTLNNASSNLRWMTRFNNTSRGNKGKKLSKTHLDAIHKGCTKTVRCIDTGEVFESITIAAEMTASKRAGISEVLNGRQRTTNGLRWEYAWTKEM